MLFFFKKRQNLHIHFRINHLHDIFVEGWQYDHNLLSWVWITYVEWKHKPYRCISLHTVHNINYFHFTVEQMSEGSQSYPERSTSKFVNTISVAFYHLLWQEREKVKSTLCMNRNIQQPINIFNYAGIKSIWI